MASGGSRTIICGSKSDRISYLIGSDEIIDYTCNPCINRTNATVKAACYCSVCDEFCCEPCLQVHNSFKANTSHVIYGRDKMEYWGQQSGNSVSIVPTEECPDHPGEWLKMICLNHTVLCCSACAVLTHRTCPDMKYLPNIATGIGESQDMSKVGNNIERYIKFVEVMIDSDKKTQTTVKKSKTEFLDTIKSIRKQANDFFNSLEENATIDMEKCHADTTTGLHQHMKDLNDTKDNLIQLQVTIQPLSTNSEAQLFIRMFMAQQKLAEIQSRLQKMTKTSQTKNFSITKDPKLQEMLSTVKSLVMIEAEITTIPRHIPRLKPLPILQLSQSPSSSTQTLPPEQTRIKQPQSSSSSSQVVTTSPTVSSSHTLQEKQTQRYTTTNGRYIDIKMSSDKFDCKILGSCQMINGDILLNDYENKNVKRLNRNYEPTDYMELQAKPRTICCISAEEAVVTDENRTIHFLSITKDKMSETRFIKVDNYCFGVAHHNGRLFVTNRGTKLNIYTTSGKCLQKLKKDKSGLDIFSESLRICLSPDGRKVYVADTYKGLVTLDSDGNHVSTYNRDNLRNASGVCVDSQGRVLVCGCDSQNVLQLDEGCSTVVGGDVSFGDGIECPASLCIDNRNSRLIISKGNRITACNHIRVFDLKLVG